MKLCIAAVLLGAACDAGGLLGGQRSAARACPYGRDDSQTAGGCHPAALAAGALGLDGQRLRLAAWPVCSGARTQRHLDARILGKGR